MNTIGTISRGIKAPIIKTGDNLIQIVTDSLLKASKEGNFSFQDRDIVGVTEAVVAKSQGNYATIEQIAKDVRVKTGGESVGLLFPILSRNRFAIILKAISMGCKKIYLQLSYPSDEVGNPLLPKELLEENKVNPYVDAFTEEEFYKMFGVNKHPFTHIDYIQLYKSYMKENAEIILCNNPLEILKYTNTVINADIHTRKSTKSKLLKAGAKTVLSLSDILNNRVDGSGYNEDYGLYGANAATETSVKLFPRATKEFIEGLQKSLIKATGKNIEVMIYGDGAFKDPIGGIWELADPVVSPAFTSGLIGTPNEIKLKYLADNAIADLKGEEAEKAIKKLISEKGENLTSTASSLGTTPRRLTDLLGSLCDLTSGSGDKGTPIIFIQNYFSNYSN